MWYSTVRHGTVRDGAVWYGTVQVLRYGTVWYGTMCIYVCMYACTYGCRGETRDSPHSQIREALLKNQPKTEIIMWGSSVE